MGTQVTMSLVLVLAGGFGSACSAAQTPPQPQCADDAIEQARRLLAFHAGEDDRIAIEPGATELPPLSNPANERQRFQVLEVWGHVYKGRYRMRLIYHPVAGECVLMGQEILEYASL